MAFKFTSDKRAVVKNYFYVATLQGLNFILPLIILPLLEQRLGLEKFGLVMFAQYLMSFFLVISDFGFNITATREVAIMRENKQDYSDFFSSIIWFRSIMITVLFVVLVGVVFSFERFREEWLVYLLSYGMVMGQAIFPVWFFQGIEKMQVITIVNVIAKVIFTLSILFFVSTPDDYMYVPAFNSLGFIVAGLLSLILALKHTRLKMVIIPEFKTFIKESFAVTVSNITSTAGLISTGLILGIFHGDKIVGIYSIFEKMIVASKSVFMPIYQVLYPFISRKAAGSMRDHIKKLIPYIAMIGLSLSCFFFFFGEFLLTLLFDNTVFLDYIWLFEIMTIVSFTSSLTMLYVTLYAPARKLYNRRLQVLATGAIIAIISGLIFIPDHDIHAAAIIFTSVEVIMLSISVYLFCFKDKNLDIKTT
ncbi:oligosaccharide flippase family protein [Nonlabens ponticola]|uniref:Flippase n=1 Tax=Nonlabens ponticola TaxID=2496866 RepID=A0A3S9MVF6_9FLAO|nr:oligosaccharide flippase family protein [Nonlabens ponticola]AZQ43124.1 hypothetical protein EJ995_02320 [Nonlabens ponticola]